MNKQEFMSHLKSSLACLSVDDTNKSLDYYSEIIDDLVEDGKSEEEAVESLGNVEEIASRIIADTPLPKLVKANMKPKRTLKAWEIVLLVLGSPLWLSVLIAIFAVVFSVYISLMAVVLSLFITSFALFLSALGTTLSAFTLLFSKQFLLCAVFIGTTMVCVGVGLLMFILAQYSFKGVMYLGKLFINLMKKPLITKGEK